MCGLFGVAGDVLTQKEEGIFKQLMIASVLRGEDSVGVAAVYGSSYKVKDHDEETEWDITKMVGIPHDLLYTKALARVLGHTNKRALIGHDRAATRGVVNRRNAHPFGMTHLVGAHNGTLHGFQPDHMNYGTDSEALYANIEKNGVDKAIGDTEGAWALTWYDKRDGKFRILRNDQRTLYFSVTKDRRRMYWASEGDMLDWILRRNGIETEDGARLFKHDHLIEYDIFSNNPDMLKDIEIRPLKGKLPPPAVVHHHGRPFSGIDGGTQTGTGNFPVQKETPQEGESGTKTNSQTLNTQHSGEKADGKTSSTNNTKNGGSETPPKRIAEAKPQPIQKRMEPLVERSPPVNGVSVITKEGGDDQLPFVFGPATIPLRSHESRRGFQSDVPSSDGHIRTYKGYNGEVLDAKTFGERLANGCAWCRETIKHYEKFRFCREDIMLCGACMTHDDRVEIMTLGLAS